MWMSHGGSAMITYADSGVEGVAAGRGQVVDVSRRGGNHRTRRELSEHGHRERADVAVDELRLVVTAEELILQGVGRSAAEGVELRAAVSHLLGVVDVDLRREQGRSRDEG